MDFQHPPRMRTAQGELRRVGFELEFGGVDLDETADILLRLFGGQLERVSRFIYKIKQSRLGDIDLEADSNFLKKHRYAKYLEKIGLNSDSYVGRGLENIAASFAGTLVPFEIALPPLPIDSLQPIETIRRKLFQHSATGTNSGIFTAFGMQFNPELPDLTAPTILSYLRAFFVLFDWLVEEEEIPLARRIAPFIHAFPQEYIDLVLQPDYAPDLDQLMDDYLKLNPTRNRPLDMLPLFAHINPDKVFSYPVEKDLVKPRPTFHYRLPNSEVDNAEWSIAREWNRWVKVEVLASEPHRLLKMCEDYEKTRDRDQWVGKTRSWIHAHVP
jgi:hypothetical protein